jgi:hypothetical protein
MPMLDIFNGDAFSVVSLTDAINKLKFVPGRIGAMGLFQESGVSETKIAIEERDGILKLIAPTPRGGPGTTLDKTQRTLRSLVVPHFEVNDGVMAEEVQGVRAWGSETAVETVQGKVAERLQLHSQSMEATHEYSRIGAVKGVVTYADGSTLDLFDQFDVSQIGEIDFDLDNANPTGGALRKACAGVIRSVAGVLEGVPFSGVHAFCGDAFFDDLIAHTEVRASYLQQQEASQLRTGYIDDGAGGSYGSFNFGGITFENYRGSVDGTAFIETNKCHLFPTGVPGLFRTYYAPADYIETVNTNGQRMYAKQYEMPNGKGIHLDSQMNALDICTRPRALLKGKRT